MNFEEFKTSIVSLTVFRELLEDDVIRAMACYIYDFDTDNQSQNISNYCEFVTALYRANSGNITQHIWDIVSNSENVYVKTIGQGRTVPECIKASTFRELDILNRLASLTKKDLTMPMGNADNLPDFETESMDIAENYKYRVEFIGKFGYGKYARNRMFCIDKNGEIVPVKNADNILLSSLVDYQRERDIVINNTKALLMGKPAANILLTGDAGTGKSSTVKAIGNEFYSEGLRIVEVRKEQLSMIPALLEELSQNPLKFILFIDDLSFLSDDDNFNALKAVLEGSVSAKSGNVVIYATSNRRHIIRENFSDRDGDDIHRNDTIQEAVSLSNRFGIHITFSKPDKTTYLDIVRHIAKEKHITIPDDELTLLAERFALERGGRSARLAKQFIDGLLSK